jgi:hypothetical protein
MPAIEAESRHHGPVERFVRGAVPLAVVCILLLGFKPDSSQPKAAPVLLLAVSGAALWLGWNPIQRNVGTRWLGRLLAAYLGVMLGAVAVGVVLQVGIMLLPLFLLALPLLLYDLLFRSPYKGRFERVRAERRHLRS